MASSLKLKSSDIVIHSSKLIEVRPPVGNAKRNTTFVLSQMKKDLPNIMVKGLKTVKRAVMQVLDKPDANGQQNYELVVEGTDLLTILSTPGIVGERVISNHIYEVYQTLGIEAARATIINEMQKTMSSHGISVDIRHLMLLSDVMCHRGDVLGINRGGMAKMRESVLMLASFEQMSDHLYEAAYHGQKDAIRGVTESIIMGIPMAIGTGCVKLLENHTTEPSGPMCREMGFDLQI